MSVTELFYGLMPSAMLAKVCGIAPENLSTSILLRNDCLVICKGGESYHRCLPKNGSGMMYSITFIYL